MGNNLAYLPEVNSSEEVSDSEPKYYVYDFEDVDVNKAISQVHYMKYGALYNFPSANTSCPAGWHLPTDEEWKTLERYLGMAEEEVEKPGERGTDEGNMLKGTYDWAENGNGDDSYGFAALPGGILGLSSGSDGQFESLSLASWFWTATAEENIPVLAFSRGLANSSDKIIRITSQKSWGVSVRCVKDN